MCLVAFIACVLKKPDIDEEDGASEDINNVIAAHDEEMLNKGHEELDGKISIIIFSCFDRYLVLLRHIQFVFSFIITIVFFRFCTYCNFTQDIVEYMACSKNVLQNKL